MPAGQGLLSWGQGISHNAGDKARCPCPGLHCSQEVSTGRGEAPPPRGPGSLSLLRTLLLCSLVRVSIRPAWIQGQGNRHPHAPPPRGKSCKVTARTWRQGRVNVSTAVCSLPRTPLRALGQHPLFLLHAPELGGGEETRDVTGWEEGPVGLHRVLLTSLQTFSNWGQQLLENF